METDKGHTHEWEACEGLKLDVLEDGVGGTEG